MAAALDPIVHAVAVSGPAGVGKTRLTVEACSELDRRLGIVHVAATRSVAGVPLGAFAPVLPTLESPSIDIDVLQRAHAELRAQTAGRRLTLVVDDAHVLDDVSASLVHQVAMSGDAVVVLTLRSGEPLPDAIHAVIKDDRCRHLHVHALDAAAVDAVLADALGAVDTTTRRRLWSATEGNLLLLRELLEAGRIDGHLRAHDGVWIWDGPLASGHVVELFATRLRVYDDDERRVLDLLALGEPLGLELMTKVVPLAAIERLERAGLVRVRVDDRRSDLVLAHPLYGEVAREQMGSITRATVSRQLADLVEGAGAQRREDQLRVATWRLDGGGDLDGAQWAAAARAAIVRQDLELAERLARTAADHGAPDAVAHLTEALFWQGRYDDAEAVYQQFDARDIDDELRHALSISRAGNLFWGLDRTDDAVAVLRTDQSWTAAQRADANGQRSLIEVMSGDVATGITTARQVYASGDRAHGRARAAGAYMIALAMQGATRTALATADDALAGALALGDHDPMPSGSVLVGHVLALIIDADGATADELASSLAGLSTDPSDKYRGLWALLVGRALVCRGHVDTALVHLREASALLDMDDIGGLRAWCFGTLAQAAAQRGDSVDAHAAVCDAEASAGAHRLWRIDIDLGSAWAHAASGERSRAEAIATSAAERALDQGQPGAAMHAWHELSRIGAHETALAGLEQIDVETDRAELARRSITAIVTGDGSALDAFAQRFADRGADLLAAECAAHAAEAHRVAGLRASQLASRQRALGWLSQCGAARTPALATLEAPELGHLTPREREVAEMAGGGRTRNEIGERLGVSERTVANHLTHIYAKLDVSSRAELAKLLGLDPP